MASKNIVASLLLVLTIALILYLPSIGFALFSQVFIIASLYEYYRFVGIENISAPLVMGGIISLSFVSDMPILSHSVLLIALLTYLGSGIFSRKYEARPLFEKFLLVAFGWLYIPWLMGHIILIRYMQNGTDLVLFLFLFTVFRNIAAGLLGKHVRGHYISIFNKKKTYEGALLGLVASMIVMAGIRNFSLESISMDDFIFFALIIGILGQVGDLVESMVKRAAGVESSSNYLGGQGGFLDTVDSFAFTAPGMYYYLWAKSMVLQWGNAGL